MSKDPLKSFKAGNPPDFSKLDPLEGRSREQVSMLDRVRAQVISVLNPELGAKLEKKMPNKITLAAETPRLKYESADVRGQQTAPPEMLQLGDTEYSRNVLLSRFGFGDLLRQKENDRRRKNDSTAPEMLGVLKADRPFNLEDERDTAPSQSANAPTSKSAAEGRSIDTAARDGGLTAVRNLRQALNLGKKKPAESRSMVDMSASTVAKKEALETAFIAGLAHAANGPAALGILSTPAKLAAFIDGFSVKFGNAIIGAPAPNVPTTPPVAPAPAPTVATPFSTTELTPRGMKRGKPVKTYERVFGREKPTPVDIPEEALARAKGHTLASLVNDLRAAAPLPAANPAGTAYAGGRLLRPDGHTTVPPVLPQELDRRRFKNLIDEHNRLHFSTEPGEGPAAARAFRENMPRRS